MSWLCGVMTTSRRAGPATAGASAALLRITTARSTNGAARTTRNRTIERYRVIRASRLRRGGRGEDRGRRRRRLHNGLGVHPVAGEEHQDRPDDAGRREEVEVAVPPVAVDRPPERHARE